MSLKGKHVAILVEQFYEEMEVWYPLLRLREAGVKVSTVGPGRAAAYKGKHGYEVPEDLPIAKAKANQFDGVIVPGGYAPDHIRRTPAMVQLVKEIYQHKHPVGAICHGAWVLASAGVLRGKRCTCFFAIKDDVVNAGASYVDREVVRDGQLITSRMPADLPAFMQTYLAALAE
ncbi:MAG: type 1 glutamine amidotransferase [Candidatus Omnitrophica bacterium]|nr:type 1 glutamine amidotransferase [Candidatus Omnitrophota bacterium]